LQTRGAHGADQPGVSLQTWGSPRPRITLGARGSLGPDRTERAGIAFEAF